jgi:hypothetical protein
VQYTNANTRQGQSNTPSVQRKHIAPGKQTRSGSVGRRAPAVQARGGGADPASVHEAAAKGISGSSLSMPHASAIQQSFGHHDVSQVQAHVGGDASAACDDMSAMAYAMGTHVAFRDTPDLHTAAHEAAHVVQQQAGVQLADGVGRQGDAYERHADVVADRVVRGESAESLLGGMTGAASPSSGVQQKSVVQKDGDDAPECRELGMFEALGLLAKVVFGSPLTEEEQVNLQGYIQGLSNDQFAALVRVSDTVGILQRLTRGIYGSDADPAGGDEQVEIPVICYRFWNAADQIQADVETANTIYNHHDITILKVSERTISKAETEVVVGSEVDDDFKLDRTYAGDAGEKQFTHADMAAVVRAYVPTSVIAGLWAKRVVNQNGVDLAGTSSPAFIFGDGYHKLAAVATDHSGADTFAHELGHVLTDEGHTPSGLMETGSTRDKTQTGEDRLTDEQIETIKATTLGWVRQAAAGG